MCVCVSHSVMSDPCDPMDCSLPGFSVHRILQAGILEWVASPDSSAGQESACNAGDLALIPGLGRSPGEGGRLPTSVFWPGEFHGKESDTTEPLSLCHSLLQRIFLIQELNLGLLHCRQILY